MTVLRCTLDSTTLRPLNLMFWTKKSASASQCSRGNQELPPSTLLCAVEPNIVQFAVHCSDKTDSPCIRAENTNFEMHS
jgi:hypothetical protein